MGSVTHTRETQMFDERISIEELYGCECERIPVELLEEGVECALCAEMDRLDVQQANEELGQVGFDETITDEEMQAAADFWDSLRVYA